MPAIPLGALLTRTGDTDDGPARLIRSTGPSRGRIKVLWTGAEYEMNLGDLPFSRLCLFSGVPVGVYRADGPRGGEILAYLGDGADGLLRYRVKVADDEVVLAETQLQPLPPNRSDPLSLFRSNLWQSSKSHRRRQSFLRMISTWNAQTVGMPSLMGVRAEPMGHQLYAMRRVLSSSRPRFILADEVGLGKTIEAGLVIQALMQENPKLRVLVVAPGSMSRQWFSEIYLRFGARAFGLIEAQTLITQGNGAREFARRRLEEGRVILSTTALLAAPTLSEWITEMDWDVVVIDEAHRISHGHKLYPVIEKLASRSTSFLALSATPSSKELAGLSSLLALVAPGGAFHAGETRILEQRVAARKRIWHALNNTIRYLEAARRENAELVQDDFEFLSETWGEATKDDPIIVELTSSIRDGSTEAVEELVSYVQEHHRVDQRLVRTRRSTLTMEGRQWPERRLETVEYDPSNAEVNVVNHLGELPIPEDHQSISAGLRLLYERILTLSPTHALNLLRFRLRELERANSDQNSDAFERLLQDPEPGYELVLQKRILQTSPPLPDETRWLKTAISLVEEWDHRENHVPRRFHSVAEWIDRHLAEEAKNKVLVFCQEADVVVEFASHLKLKHPTAIETFHYQMPEEELSQVAHRFQRASSCRVLVSDELGGEGRNFQIATAVVHLDTPWSVARIEQRIGRLDRIARSADQDVLSVIALGPAEIERTIFKIHRDIFRVYHRSIGGLEFGLPGIQKRIANAMRGGVSSLLEVRNDLIGTVSTEMSKTDEAFDIALDSSRRQLSEATVIARGLTEAQQLGGGGDFLLHWAEKLGFRVTRHPGSQVEIKVDPDWYRGPKNRFPFAGPKLFSGTFKHSVAIENDSLQFFGPGHELIDFLVSEFQTEGEGRAAMAKVPVSTQEAGRLFAKIFVRCSPGLGKWDKDSLPPALRLTVAQTSPVEERAVLFELLPHQDTLFRPMAGEEQDLVAHLYGASNTKRLSPEELNSVAPLTLIWQSVSAAILEAVSQIQAEREGMRKANAERLTEHLIFDRRYLEWRSAHGDEHASKELPSFDHAVQSILEESVEIDSVYLVLGVAE